MKDDHLVSVAQLAEFIKLGNTARFKSTSSNPQNIPDTWGAWPIFL